MNKDFNYLNNLKFNNLFGKTKIFLTLKIEIDKLLEIQKP